MRQKILGIIPHLYYKEQPARPLNFPRCCPGETSRSGYEALDRLCPLSARGINAGDFTWPGARHVRWRPSEEDDSLPWVRCPDLLVEFLHLFRGISPNVEHHEIVDIGLPEKSCSGDLFSFMHLDSLTSQHGSAHLARCLAAVDEEDSLATTIGTFWRWLKHSTLRVSQRQIAIECRLSCLHRKRREPQ